MSSKLSIIFLFRKFSTPHTFFRFRTVEIQFSVAILLLTHLTGKQFHSMFFIRLHDQNKITPQSSLRLI